jgi:hypothetical protein
MKRYILLLVCSSPSPERRNREAHPDTVRNTIVREGLPCSHHRRRNAPPARPWWRVHSLRPSTPACFAESDLDVEALKKPAAVGQLYAALAPSIAAIGENWKAARPLRDENPVDGWVASLRKHACARGSDQDGL